MQRLFSQGITYQYIMRTLTICMGVLCIFLLLYSGIEKIRREEHRRLYLEGLRQTLGLPLLRSLQDKDEAQIEVIFQGFILGQGIMALRVEDEQTAWRRGTLHPRYISMLPSREFVFTLSLPESQQPARNFSVRIEIAADHGLQQDAQYLSIVLALAGSCFVALIAFLGLHVRASIVQPLHDLQEKIGRLRYAQLLDDPDALLAAKQAPEHEFDELELSFLQLLRELQLEHREAMIAKSNLDFLNKNMTIELQLRQKKLEDELARSLNNNKLTALAEMASGIAHEINNPLAILIARTTQLRGFIIQFPSEAQNLESIIDSMESKIFRIQESIADLETIACHPTMEEAKAIKLHRVLHRLHNLASHRFTAKGLRISLEIDRELEIFAREVELTQAILYLIENAAEAAQKRERPWVAIQLAADEGDHAVIRVIDSGPGIDVAMREKIFQPFFTTKEVGKGRGVGLSLAQSIVQANGGRLAFSFDAPHTTVSITMPLSKGLSDAA